MRPHQARNTDPLSLPSTLRHIIMDMIVCHPRAVDESVERGVELADGVGQLTVQVHLGRLGRRLARLGLLEGGNSIYEPFTFRQCESSGYRHQHM
jgi:hypothetical protein